MKTIFLLIFLFEFLFCTSQNKIISDPRHGRYLDKTVIFKIKLSAKSKCSAHDIADAKIHSVFNDVSILGLKQKFPHSALAKNGKIAVDISTIYEMKYSADIPVDKLIFRLKQHPDIQYAVPHTLVEPLYEPDDPYLSGIWTLDKIRAIEAWDTCKGDTGVIIAIADWGTDNDHEDLMYNVAYNLDDPIDGVDNDFDGFVDNFRGWDMGDDDNNPQAESCQYHGIWVSGIAAASADNNTGTAGVGFKSRFFHVKVSDTQCNGVAGYEAIVYAADHGASVVNCSWGDSLEYNDYGQDVVNYATSHNCLVVAAAGNYHSQRFYYPASYEHVMSVCGTNQNDVLTSWTNGSGEFRGSSYGTRVDIAAPDYYYTTEIDGYRNIYNGTSFTAPVVSGCAAIVKARYPGYSAEQIREVLKVTADNIDTVPANNNYKELLGAGRVNLYKAVTGTLPPSVIFHSFTVTDGNDNWPDQNDTVMLKGFFTNYLNPSVNLTAAISTTSPFILVISNQINIGITGTMDTVNNFSAPFVIKIKNNAPYDTPVKLKIVYNDDATGYHAIQWVELIVRQSYADIYPNNISTTITSNGNFGYNYFMQLNGIGFRYKNYDQSVYDAGLIFGNAATRVSSCVRQSTSSFARLAPVTQVLPPLVANEYYTASFSDNANPNALNITTLQDIFAWHDDPAADFIIAAYCFINNDTALLQNMHAGIFADWDIGDFSTNHIKYNSQYNFSYAYSNSQDDFYIGMKLLSGQPEKHYAIDQIFGGAEGIDISQGFPSNKKFQAISTTRDEAGVPAAGNDVCDVMSAGPFEIAVHDTVRVAFALMAGENIYVLQDASVAAQQKYDSIYQPDYVNKSMQEGFNVKLYPNPSGNKLHIVFTKKVYGRCGITVYDAAGKVIDTIRNENTFDYDCSALPDGVYYLKISTNNHSITEKFVIVR